MHIILLILLIIIAVSLIAALIAFLTDQLKKKASSHKPFGPYERYIKCPLDAFLATGALIVLSPVLLVTAILVRIKLGSPILFKQERPGLNERIFRLYKFRTMTDQKDDNGNLLPEETRLTDFGKKLRATSLDELPELVNIIRGDMAVVGPRPLLKQYLSRYNAHQARRHEVRPGFTGLAQVHGRNSISWEEKFDWDIQYIDNITFKGDVQIILDTVRTVIKKDGITASGDVTMPEFMGSKKEEIRVK